MIDFMAVSLPRCGSTWVSNLLTTSNSICMHDATAKYTLDELDNYQTTKTFGISDTGLSALPKFVSSHPARKVVIIRDRQDINKSLMSIGLPTLGVEPFNELLTIDAIQISFHDLFDPKVIGPIYEYLLQESFDEERFALLVEMNVQPTSAACVPDYKVFQDFIKRVWNESR